MSDTLTPEIIQETSKMTSIAKNIEKLSSHLGPKLSLDLKTAFNLVDFYKSTFGDKGINHLDKKVKLLVGKCLVEKPEAEGLKEIATLTNKLFDLNVYSGTYKRNESYQAFVDRENIEIAYSEKVINIIKNHLEYEKSNLSVGGIQGKSSREKIADFLKREFYWITQAYEHREIWLKNKGEGWGTIEDAPSLRYFLSLQNVNEQTKHGETPVLKSRMVSTAEDINALSAHLGPRNTVDVKTALSFVELYKKTFGDEGYSFLEKKVDLFVNKYLFEKPQEEGVQQIGKLVNKLYNLKTFQFRHYDDQEGYKVFLEQEKKEITAFTHGEPPPLERRNINNKETNMSDEKKGVSVGEYLASLSPSLKDDLSKMSESILNDEKKEFSPKQQLYIESANNARFQRKVVADALKNGSLACLPGKDGYADTTPAVNIMTPHKPYHGEYQLFLKAVQKLEQNSFPTAEYVTYHQIDKARADGVEVYPRKGVHGESLIIGEQKDTGEWENKKVVLFNIAQTNNPEALKKWAEKEIEKQEQKNLEYNQTRYGSGWTPPEKKAKEHGPEIVCSSTEPEKYLGQYLAAVSMGSKFKVTPEQAAEFSEKMLSALYKPMEPIMKENGEIKKPPINKETQQPITDPFSLEKISRMANEECKDFLRDLRMQTQQQNQPERKQEQTQGIQR